MMLLLCSNCQYFSSSGKEKEDSPINEENNQVGNPIDYLKTPTIKEVFITTRDSVPLFETPDEEGSPLGYLPYGGKIEVVEELPLWYAIKESIKRHYIANEKEVIVWQWEKIYIKKQYTGDISKVTLNHKDLIATEDKKPLKKISFRFVSKDEYFAEKANAVDFTDTTNTIKKIKGKLRLPCEECKNKYITYIDSLTPYYDDNIVENTYMGEIPFLNKYLINGVYYEGGDYTLVDKTTGKKTDLNAFPYITPDKQYIITVFANIYDNSTEFSLYRISEDNEIKLLFSTIFTQWALVLDKEDIEQIFMGANGNLYAKVNHWKAHWNLNGEYNPHGQCICISIK